MSIDSEAREKGNPETWDAVYYHLSMYTHRIEVIYFCFLEVSQDLINEA